MGFSGPGGIPEASQSLWDPSCMNISPNGSTWTCFGSVFMIFLQNLAFSNLHNLYICLTETTYLLYKAHTVSAWHYHTSENPYHPSTATCLLSCIASARTPRTQWTQPVLLYLAIFGFTDGHFLEEMVISSKNMAIYGYIWRRGPGPL